jgi:hypothetical protein
MHLENQESTVQEFISLSPDALTEAAVSAGRDQALAQMKWMRQYTEQLLDSVPRELWSVVPAGAKTHIAWQVGHLAVAQYGLMLFRQRGRVEADLELMPGWLRKNFGRGSQPSTDAAQAKASSPEILLEHMRAIHEQSCKEVAELSVDVLVEPTEMPYAAYPIKLGALMFCPLHESIHAGQIGLLRRLHGLEPVR